MLQRSPSHPGLKKAFDGLPNQEIVAVARYAQDYPDTIPLWFGESDVVTDALIRESAIAALKDGETFYPDVRGLPALRSAIAGYLTGLGAREVSADRIMVTASGMAGLNLVLNGIIDNGDEAIVVTPTWPNGHGVLQLANAVVTDIATEAGEDGWRLDLAKVEAAITPRTRLLFLNSPCNPTGWICDSATQRRLLELARHHGFWIVADEVYQRIAYDHEPSPSFLDFADANDPVIVLNSFSKTWAMTGWRIGWVTAPADIIEKLVVAMEYMTSGVSTFSQHACLVALREQKSLAAHFLEYCRRGREQCSAILSGLPRVRYIPPEGGFFAFFEVDGVSDSVSEVRRLIRDHGIGLAPGTAFGETYRSWFRLCFAQSEETLTAAGERLAAGLK